MAVLGVDVGGTFTDAVVLDGGRVTTAKVLTSARQEESVIAAARAAHAETIERFAHGTTVATNALLERKGARTALVTNAGFEHLLHLRRQTRAHLYRPCAAWPEPLVPLERSHGVRGRIGPAGELEPDELKALHAGIRRALKAGIDRQGATLRDYRTPDGGSGRMQHEFKVYGREGEPCDRCGTPIEKIRAAGRGTWYCPGCQRM